MLIRKKQKFIFNLWKTNWYLKSLVKFTLIDLNISSLVSLDFLLYLHNYVLLNKYNFQKNYKLKEFCIFEYYLKSSNKVQSIDYFISFKLLNGLIYSGKKDIAIKLLLNTCILLRNNYNINPYNLFLVSVFKVAPVVCLKKRQIAGRLYQIPVFYKVQRKLLWGIKILLLSTRFRVEKTLPLQLFCEIKDILNNSINSVSLKKRNDLCKLAIDNKFFVKFL